MNSIKLKGFRELLIPLKNRIKDFLRLNPPPPMDGEPRSKEDYIFVSTSCIMKFAKTRFPNRHIHFGIQASKKSVSKRAVDRNLVKRRLRAILNDYARDFDIAGWDILIIARNPILKTRYDILETEVKNGLAKLVEIKKRNKWK